MNNRNTERNEKFYHASLEQKSDLEKAISVSNGLLDQMFDSVISLLLTACIVTSSRYLVHEYIDAHPSSLVMIDAQQFALATPWILSLYRDNRNFFSTFAEAMEKFVRLQIYITNKERFLDRGQAIINGKAFAQEIYNTAYEIFGSRDVKLIERVFKISEYAYRQAHSDFDSYIIIRLALLTPLLRYFLLEPVLKRILHWVYDWRFIGSVNFNWISDIQANDLLESIKKQNIYKKEFARHGVNFNYALALIIMTLALAEWYETRMYPNVEFIIYISSTLVKMAGSYAYAEYDKYNQNNYKIKFAGIQQKITEMLLFSYTKCSFYRFKDNKKNYVLFHAGKYKTLSANVINQTVKDILLRNGFEIIDYSNDQHTFRLRDVTLAESTAIRKQIENYISVLIKIKMLEIQIQKCFHNSDILKNISIKDGLPIAVFVINSTISDKVFQRVSMIFSDCIASKLGNTISIMGYEPSKMDVNYCTVSELFYPPIQRNEASRSAVFRRPILLANSLKTVPPALETKKVTTHTWPSGVYSSDVDGPIKPIQSSLVRNHFVMFAIPAEYFPTIDAHKKIESKILEGRVAANARGCQGLQFRTENARDLTKREKPWIVSKVRYKVKGELGDMRFYSRREMDADKNFLHIFCGMNASAHP